MEILKEEDLNEDNLMNRFVSLLALHERIIERSKDQLNWRFVLFIRYGRRSIFKDRKNVFF